MCTAAARIYPFDVTARLSLWLTRAQRRRGAARGPGRPTTLASCAAVMYVRRACTRPGQRVAARPGRMTTAALSRLAARPGPPDPGRSDARTARPFSSDVKPRHAQSSLSLLLPEFIEKPILLLATQVWSFLCRHRTVRTSSFVVSAFRTFSISSYYVT